MKRALKYFGIAVVSFYIIGWLLVVPETQVISGQFINRGLGEPISTELKAPNGLQKYSPYYRSSGIAERYNLIREKDEINESVTSFAIPVAPFVVWFSVEFYSSGFRTGSSGFSYYSFEGVKRVILSEFIT